MTEISDLLAAAQAAEQSSKVATQTKGLAVALAAWAQSIEARLAPPPASTPYAWDATKAVRLVDQTEAQHVASHLASGGRAVLGATHPVVHAPAGTPAVAVTWTPDWTPPPGTPMVYRIPIPAGTKPSSSSPDHHLAILAADGTGYGLEQYDPVKQTATGIGVVPPGAVSEVGMSNAARLDLSRVLTVDDVLEMRLRTLVFATPIQAVPGTSSVYPADTTWNDARCLYGRWLALPPDGTPPAYPNRLLIYIDACLRHCGMVNTDQADYLTILAADYVNAGGNVAAYARIGVQLDLSGGATYPIGCYLDGIPWSQLEALEPPPRIS